MKNLILVTLMAYSSFREDTSLSFCQSFSSPQPYDTKRSAYAYTHRPLLSHPEAQDSDDTADKVKSQILNRRDAILSTTNAAIAAASSSLILLQNPSPSWANEDEASTSTSTSTSTPNASSLKKSISLNSSSSCSATPSTSKPFPLASFGLQIYDNDKAYKLTTIALEAGYRNFFASVLAGNQKGFAKAIRDSNIPISELYICGTVLSNRAVGYKAAYSKTFKGCEENLSIMNQYSNGKIETLDMIMLDYPCTDDESIRGQWDAFQSFQKMNHVNDLAVSNFNARQLDCILLKNDSLCSRPTVNQLPFSIANHPKYMLEDNERRNIHVQSWSPLSSTLPRYRDVMAGIGTKYNKTAAQVGLRWIVQSGASYCVQSQKESHFREDLDVFDFELNEKDMEILDTLAPPRLLG